MTMVTRRWIHRDELVQGSSEWDFESVLGGLVADLVCIPDADPLRAFGDEEDDDDEDDDEEDDDDDDEEEDDEDDDGKGGNSLFSKKG